MGIDALIGLILVYIVIFIWKGGEWLGKKVETAPRARPQKPKPEIKTLEERLDNRGYKPFDGKIQLQDGVYSTFIYGDKEYTMLHYIEASSIEELQQKCDPVLIQRHKAWLKRKARKKRRRQQDA